jgi:hypothetical protein
MKYAPVNLYNKTTNVIMRKATYLFFVTLFIVTITSCSTDNDDIIQIKLLKKVIEINTDGTSSTFNFTYNDNKISSINSELNSKTFTYTDNLITEIVELNKTNQHINTSQYLYSNGQLSKITSSDNYVLNYIYNSDGTVSYEKLTKDSQNNDVRVFHGTLYFQGGNLVKDYKVLDDAGKGILAENTVSFEYDNKNNALSNILGYNKLLDYSKTISSSNVISNSETSSVKHINEDQVISAIKINKSKPQYDSLGYPIEIVSENLIFGGNDSKHLKSILFYN